MIAKLTQAIEECKGDAEAFRSFWISENKQLLRSLKSKSKAQLLALLQEKLLLLDLDKVVHASSKERFERQEDLIISYQYYLSLNEEKDKREAKKRIELTENRLAAARQYERKTLENLSKGRAQGVQQRKAEASSKKARIKELLEEMYRDGEGWKMGGYKVIADSLLKKVEGYRYSSMLKVVKELAPSIKQKYRPSQ